MWYWACCPENVTNLVMMFERHMAILWMTPGPSLRPLVWTLSRKCCRMKCSGITVNVLHCRSGWNWEISKRSLSSLLMVAIKLPWSLRLSSSDPVSPRSGGMRPIDSFKEAEPKSALLVSELSANQEMSVKLLPRQSSDMFSIRRNGHICVDFLHRWTNARKLLSKCLGIFNYGLYLWKFPQNH